MQDWLLLTVLSAATFRATRLVTRDDFPPVAWARDRVRLHGATSLGDDKDGEPVWHYRWWGELVTCHWCASGWLALAAVGFTCVFAPVPLPALSWLAVWGAGAVLADRLG